VGHFGNLLEAAYREFPLITEGGAGGLRAKKKVLKGSFVCLETRCKNKVLGRVFVLEIPTLFSLRGPSERASSPPLIGSLTWARGREYHHFVMEASIASPKGGDSVRHELRKQISYQ
jgi:hypothetical protein